MASGYGLTADEWQENVLEGWLGRARDGKWAAGRCGLSVPRQNGKNGVLEVRELFGMVLLGEKILHTAHEVKTARKAFKRLMWFFGSKVADPAAAFPELNALVIELRQTNGQEAIILANGGSVEFIARSKGSGRGFTVDVLVCDEAQELSDEALEALMPTISSAPLQNPQIIFTGTPPGPTMNGEAFKRMRSNALKPSAGRVCWKEWSVERPERGQPALDLDDRGVWTFANPSLGIRLLPGVIEDERAQFSDEGFMRERLGMWDPEGAAVAGVLDVERWGGLTDTAPKNAPKVMAAFAIEVDLDRAWASIGAAGRRPDGRVHVELVDRKRGTGWLFDRAVELHERHGGRFVVDGGGPAGSLVSRLEEAGLDVLVAGTGDVAEATAGLVDGINEGTLAHGPQAELDAAVRGARKRPFRDGGFAFGRVKSDVDVTPLIAVTLAHWVASKAPQQAPQVWSIAEMVEELKREQAGAAPELSVEPVTRPDGSRFIPL